MITLQLPFWDFFKYIYTDVFSMSDFDNIGYFLCIFLIICTLLLFGIIVYAVYKITYDYFDKRSSTKKDLSGILIDKKYIGEQSSSGTVTAIIPNTSEGVGIDIVSTSSHSDEEFLFFIKSDKVYKIQVDMQIYYRKNIGDNIYIEVTTGGLSKKMIEIKFIK